MSILSGLYMFYNESYGNTFTWCWFMPSSSPWNIISSKKALYKNTIHAEQCSICLIKTYSNIKICSPIWFTFIMSTTLFWLTFTHLSIAKNLLVDKWPPLTWRISLDLMQHSCAVRMLSSSLESLLTYILAVKGDTWGTTEAAVIARHPVHRFWRRARYWETAAGNINDKKSRFKMFYPTLDAEASY